MLEAEVKLALSPDGLVRLRQRLAACGAVEGARHEQVDTYFAHPQRDFAATDEALRLRCDEGALRITYKGPKLDPPLKTREEIELALVTDLATARTLLERLGFAPVATVRKHRTDLRLPGEPPVTLSLDQVDGLGWFCELETQSTSVGAGRAALRTWLARLDLGREPQIAASYLELLLARRPSSEEPT